MSKLRILPNARRELDKASLEEVESAIDLFMHILSDPEAGTPVAFYPNQPMVKEIANADWYLAFTFEEGSVVIRRLYRWSDLPDDPMAYRVS